MTRFDFNSLVGAEYLYYGSRDGRFFRLDDQVFEAVEIWDDEAASHMACVMRSVCPLYTFYKYPLALVKLCREGTLPVHDFFEQVPDQYSFNGYSLVSANDHVWLYFGTDSYCSMGSRFIFKERPSAVIQQILSLQDPIAVDAALEAYSRELERLR